MPIVVIYKNIHYQMIPVIYNNITLCFDAVQKYLKSLDIYDDEFQDELDQAETIKDLMNIIEDYDIEQIIVYKAFEYDPKELI